MLWALGPRASVASVRSSVPKVFASKTGTIWPRSPAISHLLTVYSELSNFRKRNLVIPLQKNDSREQRRHQVACIPISVSVEEIGVRSDDSFSRCIVASNNKGPACA